MQMSQSLASIYTPSSFDSAQANDKDVHRPPHDNCCLSYGIADLDDTTLDDTENNEVRQGSAGPMEVVEDKCHQIKTSTAENNVFTDEDEFAAMLQLPEIQAMLDGQIVPPTPSASAGGFAINYKCNVTINFNVFRR